MGDVPGINKLSTSHRFLAGVVALAYNPGYMNVSLGISSQLRDGSTISVVRHVNETVALATVFVCLLLGVEHKQRFCSICQLVTVYEFEFINSGPH